MIIYWRIGQLVLGVYIVIQALIFVISKLSINAETMRGASQTLLNAHLHQRLPEYYHKVSESTEVWESLPASLHNRQFTLLDTLLAGKTVTVLDSVFTSNERTDHRWLKISFEGKDQRTRTGWILAPRPGS